MGMELKLIDPQKWIGLEFFKWFHGFRFKPDEVGGWVKPYETVVDHFWRGWTMMNIIDPR